METGKGSIVIPSKRRSNSSSTLLPRPRPLTRRGSHDCLATHPSFVVEVESGLKALEAEDTDGDHHITIDDVGPKTIALPTAESGGSKSFTIHGNYPLSNLLQELSAAKEAGQAVVTVSYDKLHENPVDRLSRLIRDVFWPGLTRRLDAEVIGLATKDPKNFIDGHARIYVPFGADSQLRYYSDIAASNPDLHLKVETLPEKMTIDRYRKLCEKPGLLALDTEEYMDGEGQTKTRSVPFMVPGGCYNEFYGWDSHFIGLGLLQEGMTDLVRGIIKNFIFEIQYYGLIPNANRSYYLLRSQPPFLTDLSLRLYKATVSSIPDAKEFLRRGLQAAAKEYHSVWMSALRLDPETGLSLFAPDGVGVPPECDVEHFAKILQPYADKHGMSLKDFTDWYNGGGADEPELDEYFKHDRGVRESGHDTSTRVEHTCAYLATVDLNCLLYKYETDIASAITEIFGNDFSILPEFRVDSTDGGNDSVASTWMARAEKRKEAMNRYLWNEKEGIFSDYHVKLKRQIDQECPTTYWTLWCGLASPQQAAAQVAALPKFECLGGLASTSDVALDRDAAHPHQWDYPYGWAPHQMMAWEGLARYGYGDEATRLAYKWLWVIMKVFVDYNGAILEKYEVTNDKDPHRCGGLERNEGGNFHGFAKEGFGWTNSSFGMGLGYLDERMKRALAVCAPWHLLDQKA